MKNWWLRLVRFAPPQWLGLSLIILLMLIEVGLDLLRPWPLKLLVDHTLTDQPLPNAAAWITNLPGGETPAGQLIWLATATILLFIVNQAIGIIQSYWNAGVSQRMTFQLGAQLFDYLQRLSLRFHSRQPTGDLVRRVIKDCSCISDLITGVLLTLVTSLVSLVAMFIVIWQLNRSIALLALLVAPVMVFLIRRFDRPMTERTYEHQKLEGEMMALAEQTLTALPVIQAFSREDDGDQRFHSLSQRTIRASVRAIASQLQFQVGVDATTAIGTATVMLIGGILVLQGQFTLGGLLVVLSYLASLYSPLSSLAYLSSGFASAAARARRVLEILEIEDAVRDLPGAKPLPRRGRKKIGNVALEEITFGYEPGQPVLNGVTLSAHSGEVIALVGKTGAGKSTLVSLIPRFFDPWQGQVRFNGVDIRKIQLASLRSQVSFVLQEPFLLPFSVAENIAYGRPRASMKEIISAATAARADQFICQLPKGYETNLGERGSTLSGGQRQRIAIARALLKNAPILILDEPTSALDAETEGQLLEALERLIAGRTTFVIAHRLSTIQQADRIAVIEDGRIVEMGIPRELLAAGGAYFNLHRLQSGGQPL